LFIFSDIYKYLNSLLIFLLTSVELQHKINTMITRKQISSLLDITEQYLSMLLIGQRLVSWPLASKLADLFPGRTIQQWKAASPDDLRRAFKLLELDKVA